MTAKKDIKILGCVAAALLLIASFADLQISETLYNQESVFGKIFEAIGEFPAILIASFCSVSIAVVQKNRNQGKLNVKCVLGFVVGVLFVLMAGSLPVTYLNGPKVLGVVLGIVFLVSDVFLARFIARERGEELYKAAVLGLQLFLIVILAFNLVKIGWGRERYRHMVEIGTVAGFSPWYIPQGLAPGNEFMSFPSGHSANASIVMWITLLPTFLPSFASKEKVLKIAAGVWIGCVMISRVIMGAHFLSDVTMGMTISLAVFYGLCMKKYK